MPYAKCPHCGSTFHLRLTEEGSRRWEQDHSQSIAAGQTVPLACFHCWKELHELEVVEVLESPPQASEIVIGEKGTVVAVLKSLAGEVAYEVEAIASDGSTKWLHTFVRSQLKAVIPTKT